MLVVGFISLFLLRRSTSVSLTPLQKILDLSLIAINCAFCRFTLYVYTYVFCVPIICHCQYHLTCDSVVTDLMLHTTGAKRGYQ